MKIQHPLRQAISEVAQKADVEVRVFLTRRFFEKNPPHRGKILFTRIFGTPTAGQSQHCVLVYLNLRRLDFALVSSDFLTQSLGGAAYWRHLAHQFQEDLSSTHYENALSLLVRTLGASLSLRSKESSKES